MKTQLTAEQSAKLTELGVSPERASERTPDYTDINNTGRPLERRELLPIFTFADILDLLPKEIKRNAHSNYTLYIVAGNHYWNVEYRYCRSACATDTLALFGREELIDALYALLVWCLEEIRRRRK